MTTREVADLAGVDTTTVRRWALSGALRSTTTDGGRYRFDRDLVEARFLRHR